MPARAAAAPSLVVESTAHHFPEHTVSTAEIIAAERPGGLMGERVRAQIGCERVHVAGPEDSPSALAVKVAERALEAAALTADAIELIVSVPCTPSDFDMWSLPAKVAKELGALGAEAFGVGEVGCAGAFAALRAVAPIMLAPGGPQTALIVVPSVTPGRHFFPPATVFGDGAGAMVLRRRAHGRRGHLRLVRADLYSFPQFIDAYNSGAGVELLRQEGRLERGWFAFGVRDPDLYSTFRTTHMELGADAARRTLERAGWTVDDLRYLVADNVSVKVGQALGAALGVPHERVVGDNCSRFGHAYAADLFVNLSTAFEAHPLSRGDRILCAAMGIGHHWGFALFEMS